MHRMFGTVTAGLILMTATLETAAAASPAGGFREGRAGRTCNHTSPANCIPGIAEFDGDVRETNRAPLHDLAVLAAG